MARKRVLGWLGLCIILLGWSGLGWSIPAMLAVSGRLLDAKGEPIHYYETDAYGKHEIQVALVAELKFFDSETAQTSIHTLNATAVANNGYFSIQFTLPGSVLTKDQIFYTLAIDTDRNGLTSADLFASRFQFGSVPFALSAKPAHAFTTHGGQAMQATSYDFFKNLMQVAPFETPPGGVEFNKMNIELGSGMQGDSFAFGIYDEQGKLVTNSGRINIKDVSVSAAFLEVKLPQTVRLEPSRIYYTGLARNSKNPAFRPGLKPGSPVYGFVTIPLSDGSVPNSFDPTQIDPDERAIPLPITLSLISDQTSSVLVRQGMDMTKPQIRWVYLKTSKVVKAKAQEK